MKKININLNFLKRLNKKVVCMIGGVILAIAVIVTIVILALNNKSNEKELNAKLEELSASFYEGFYYDAMVKNYGINQVAQYANVGIKVSLDNLIRSSGLDKDEELTNFFVNSKTGKACDKNNTKVIIYPQDPYEKKDYKLEIVLKCGFDKEEKDENATTTTTTTKN